MICEYVLIIFLHDVNYKWQITLGWKLTFLWFDTPQRCSWVRWVWRLYQVSCAGIWQTGEQLGFTHSPQDLLNLMTNKTTTNCAVQNQSHRYHNDKIVKVLHLLLCSGSQTEIQANQNISTKAMREHSICSDVKCHMLKGNSDKIKTGAISYVWIAQ